MPHEIHVRSEAELVAAANASLVDSFRKLLRHIPESELRETGGVFAFTTGLPTALFNGCVVVEAATESDFDAAIAWVDGRAAASRAWIDEARAPGLVDVAVARGYAPDAAPYPGMVLHPVPEAPPAPPGVSIVRVTPQTYAEHLEVRIASGLPPELARRLFPESFAADPDVQLFTARLDGRPVGASAAIRTGDVGGIYAVGTLADARRRGVGTAVSWAAVAASRAWGCDTVVLQASEMGHGLYAAMGFRTVVPYATLKRAAPQR